MIHITQTSSFRKAVKKLHPNQKKKVDEAIHAIIENPKIGLLNIGEEPEKGNLLAQAAHGLMKESKDFNFIGNIEGRDIFDNKADVVFMNVPPPVSPLWPLAIAWDAVKM